jgi:hypothetical protein
MVNVAAAMATGKATAMRARMTIEEVQEMDRWENNRPPEDCHVR